MNIHTSTEVQIYEVEEKGMKNAGNRLVRQRWDMAVPTSSAFG